LSLLLGSCAKETYHFAKETYHFAKETYLTCLHTYMSAQGLREVRTHLNVGAKKNAYFECGKKKICVFSNVGKKIMRVFTM